MTTTEPYDGVYGIYWVSESEPIGADIVSINRNYRLVPLPPFLIAVVGDDSGDEYCLDTRHPDEQGGDPIVRFDHECHHEGSTNFETVARDLGEFLLESLGEDLILGDRHVETASARPIGA